MGRLRPATKLVKLKGALEGYYKGSLSFPIYNSASIRFDSCKEHLSSAEGFDSCHGNVDPELRFDYGRRYNPTDQELSTLLARLEVDADQAEVPRVVLFPSGMMSIAVTLGALCPPGSVVMMSADAYKATRQFAHHVLTRLGAKIVCYDCAEQLEALASADTALIFCESPSSLLCRFYDLQLIVKVAKRVNAITVVDNSWATFLGFRPLEIGIDVVLYSLTKYVSGHSDALMGSVATCNLEAFRRINQARIMFGVRVSSYECFLVQRGLKTLALRLKQHDLNALKIVEYLSSRSEVRHICYPTLLAEDQRALWQQNYEFANGLVSVILKPNFLRANIERMIDAMEIFNIGLSWGGCHSMVLLNDISDLAYLSGVERVGEEPILCVRLFCGLEDHDDLLEDLSQAFDRLYS